MAVDRAVTKAHVTTPAGRVIGIPEGSSLVFGRGPDADLVIAAGRGLSRRAGQISAIAGGALVANISATHALYAEGDGFRIRLPRLDAPGEPAGGWFAARGTTLVGSRSMLDEGQPLRLVVSATPGELDPGEDAPGGAAGGDATVLPLYLDPNTKLFLVALIWCRPWLIDPARSTPLPRTPEIARAALEVTDAERVFQDRPESAELELNFPLLNLLFELGELGQHHAGHVLNVAEIEEDLGKAMIPKQSVQLIADLLDNPGREH